jgi:protein-S-isoprenylcysteine O-methyltransferase Ste14
MYLAAFGCGLLVELAAPSPGLPGWLRIGGAVAGILLLLFLDTRAMLRFQRHGTPVNPARAAEALVTDGPYRFTRNPMYLGMGCAYAGAALAAEALWSLALLPLVLLIVDRVIIPREEAHLAAMFGEEYERYRGRVRRWL